MNRARFALFVPDIARGVRAAVATLLPFYLAQRWGWPELAWTALGGWLGTLADPGGLRSTRARVLVVFALAGTLVVALAEHATGTVAATLLLGALGFGGSLLRSLGATATSIGSLLVVVAAIALGGLAHDPGRDALAFLGGAAWAVLLSSIVWPVWTHLPVRLPLAACWRELAAYAAAIDRAVAEQVPTHAEAWTNIARAHQRKVRAALEEARSVALASRARRSGESAVGSNLRTLLALAERTQPLLTAALEELDPLPPAERVPTGVADKCTEIAHILATPVLRAAARPAAQHGDLSRLSDTADVARELARHLGTPPDPSGPELAGSLARADAGASLRDALSPRSAYFHHAARVALAVMAAQVVGAIVSPRHVSWITITTIGVLQPYAGATLKRAAERVVGTVLGSVVAIGVMTTVRSPIVLAALMIPLSVAAVATKPRSYRLFTLFLTPVFVLLAERWTGDWWTAAARAADAAIGGVLALAAALAFPSREAPRLQTALRVMIETLRSYARTTIEAHIAGTSASVEVLDARRRAGIAIGDAETSLERLLSEPLRSPSDDAADAMLLVTHGRRFGGALTALDQHRSSTDGDIARLVRDRVDRLLGPDPAPEPALDAPSDLGRILRQAELLADARR